MKFFDLAPDPSPAGRSALRAGAGQSDEWLLISAAILWQDTKVIVRSADSLFEAIAGTAPAVSLKNKVPTLTLPCRGLARGAAGGVSLEVTVQSNDYSTQITLNADDAAGVSREPLERAVLLAQGFGAPSAWRTLKLTCRTPLMDAEAARIAFCRTTGIELAAAQVTSQKYVCSERSEIGGADAGQFQSDLELGAYPEPDGGSWLEALVSASWTSGGVGPVDFAWPELLARATRRLEGLGANPWAQRPVVALQVSPVAST